MELSLSAFFSALLIAVSRYYPESEDPDLKPLDTPQNYLAKEYDFIIVGAGSAGCVLANRLTENKDWKVLLIEAGGDEDAISDTPLLAMNLQKTDKDWNYTSVPQKHSCLSQNGVCSYSRGRVMGGSSTINYMTYVRGNKEDYNEWERSGNIGWGYRDVLPYFIKAEHINIPSLAFSPVHGADGPLSVQYSRFQIGSREDYVRACEEVGFHLDDYNNGIQRNVVGYFQFNIKGPSRHSASAAYVNPIRHRKNLHVIKRSLVKKILIENKKAIGVQYIRNGENFNAYGKEVILSAGSFDTPKLLMMSGVGPKNDLERLGIPVIEDLPVGKGLKDHLYVNVYFELLNGQTFTPDLWRTSDSIISYARDKQGPLTAFPSEVHAFFNPFNEEAPPTIQLLFLVGYADTMCSNKTILTMGVALVYPKSVGNLKLKSRDYNDPPLIDPNFFDDEIDPMHVRKGIDKVFEIIETSSMKKFSPKLFTDFQPACRDLPSEKFKDCIVVQYSKSYYHPVGTARMGPSGDPDSVVCSADLVVRGINNLRVVDASVMPQTPRANIHASTVMVAEKASDIIKLMYKCSRKDGYSEKPKNNNRRGFWHLMETFIRWWS